MALALTVTLEAPKKAALLDVTGGAGSRIVLWRVGPSGTAAYVRGWALPGTAGTTVRARDYEVPLGVPVGYYAARYLVSGTLAEQVGPVPFELAAAADDNPWLVDLGRPLGSFPTLVESLPSQRHETPAGVHRVLGRRTPIVTSDVAWSYSAELRFVTADADDELAGRELLASGIPFLLRTPPEQGVGNAYLFPTGFAVERASRIALHPDRRFTVSVVQVDRPDPALFVPVPPTTYSAVQAAFASYTALLAARPTYDALAYDYSADSPLTPTFPPGDV